MLTRDSVTVSVDAVVYYRVSNATVSVANVENAHHSTRLLAQTTLRNILGTKTLHEILSDRESISSSMQVGLISTLLLGKRYIFRPFLSLGCSWRGNRALGHQGGTGRNVSIALMLFIEEYSVYIYISACSKDVRLPVQLQRAMAAEAEAAREARAKVIAAEGEQKASRALREASEVISDSSSALQLRYLQVSCTRSPSLSLGSIFSSAFLMVLSKL